MPLGALLVPRGEVRQGWEGSQCAGDYWGRLGLSLAGQPLGDSTCFKVVSPQERGNEFTHHFFISLHYCSQGPEAPHSGLSAVREGSWGQRKLTSRVAGVCSEKFSYI